MEAITQSFNKLKQRIKEYNPNCDFWLIDKAFNIAVVAHAEQVRTSGEPFVMHPLEVANILASIDMDPDTIVAALLHDTVEDTKYTNDDIRTFFGDHIASLVEGVTKLTKIPYNSAEEQQIDNLRRMFLAMSKDIRVIIIKLADRLHNMQTLKCRPREKQLITSRETMEVYAPIAHRLGMSRIKWELEDLSLRYLDPIAYQEIAELIHERRQEREQHLENVKDTIKRKLDEMDIHGFVEGRVKHFYSIYRKMYTQGTSLDEIYDLLAVRIIVNTQPECYEVFGMVHETFTPIPGRVKDYIAMPKNNNYQSLHTSLMGTNGKPFEVQIRTWEMHRIAEVGIAAHWKYKEGVQGESTYDNSLEWVRQLIDVQRDYTDSSEEFMRAIRMDLFADEVFVFSPKGEVIKLPVDSTPIDFAYAIHSAIGNRLTGAKVNGKIVNLEYKLKNGDMVEIITSSVIHGPKRDWLKIIKTNNAKKKINDWFKKENREENIAAGREILERELKKANIPVDILKETERFAPILERYSLHSYDDLLSIIGYGGFPALKVANRLKEQLRAEQHEVPTLEEMQHIYIPATSGKGSDIFVDGVENCKVRLAKCCNPIHGDEILGFVTRGGGVSVHRKDCINVTNSQEQQRLVDVWWTENTLSSYSTNIQMVFTSRDALVIDIGKTILDAKTPLKTINARELKNELAIIEISVEVSSKEQLNNLIKQLSKIKGLTSIKRTKH